MGEPEDLTGLNADEVIKRIEQDEIEDQPLIKPVDYAKIRPIESQLVYYRIRTGKLKTYTCNCGRRCINKEEADQFFRKLYGPIKWPHGKDEEATDESTRADTEE